MNFLSMKNPNTVNIGENIEQIVEILKEKNTTKQKASSGMIDSRIYDDIFLLSKILIYTPINNEERELILKHFRKDKNI